MTKPLVSILIVNWNGGSVFANCLSSVAKLTYSNWELIVVDNASSDSSVNLPKKIIGSKRRVVVVQNPINAGFAPANNTGLKKCKGEYILLLNNDTVVKTDLLTKLVNKMQEHKNVGVLQPKIFMMDKAGYLDNAGSFMTNIGFLEHWGFGQKDSAKYNKEREVFSAKGACMFVRKSVIDKVGLFDPEFVSYFEESDFCWRVWLAGWRVLYFPDTHISHKVGFTIRRLDVGNLNYHYYKNRISALIKNYGVLRLVLVLPIHICISVGIALAFVVRGRFGSSGMIAKAIFWNIFNLPQTISKRMAVQKLRKVSDRQIFAKLSRPVNFRKFYQDFKRVEADIAKS